MTEPDDNFKNTDDVSYISVKISNYLRLETEFSEACLERDNLKVQLKLTTEEAARLMKELGLLRQEARILSETTKDQIEMTQKCVNQLLTEIEGEKQARRIAEFELENLQRKSHAPLEETTSMWSFASDRSTSSSTLQHRIEATENFVANSESGRPFDEETNTPETTSSVDTMETRDGELSGPDKKSDWPLKKNSRKSAKNWTQDVKRKFHSQQFRYKLALSRIEYLEKICASKTSVQTEVKDAEPNSSLLKDVKRLRKRNSELVYRAKEKEKLFHNLIVGHRKRIAEITKRLRHVETMNLSKEHCRSIAKPLIVACQGNNNNAAPRVFKPLRASNRNLAYEKVAHLEGVFDQMTAKMAAKEANLAASSNRIQALKQQIQVLHQAKGRSNDEAIRLTKQLEDLNLSTNAKSLDTRKRSTLVKQLLSCLVGVWNELSLFEHSFGVAQSIAKSSDFTAPEEVGFTFNETRFNCLAFGGDLEVGKLKKLMETEDNQQTDVTKDDLITFETVSNFTEKGLRTHLLSPPFTMTSTTFAALIKRKLKHLLIAYTEERQRFAVEDERLEHEQKRQVGNLDAVRKRLNASRVEAQDVKAMVSQKECQMVDMTTQMQRLRAESESQRTRIQVLLQERRTNLIEMAALQTQSQQKDLTAIQAEKAAYTIQRNLELKLASFEELLIQIALKVSDLALFIFSEDENSQALLLSSTDSDVLDEKVMDLIRLSTLTKPRSVCSDEQVSNLEILVTALKWPKICRKQLDQTNFCTLFLDEFNALIYSIVRKAH